MIRYLNNKSIFHYVSKVGSLSHCVIVLAIGFSFLSLCDACPSPIFECNYKSNLGVPLQYNRLATLSPRLPWDYLNVRDGFSENQK